MTIDLIILILFILYSIWVGFANRKRASQGLEEYFLAGRTLTGWKAGISMAATQFAADTPLLVTGLVATAGLFSLWRLWVYALAFLMMGFILGACWRRSGVLTDAEFTELRYSGKGAALLRALKAIHLGTLVNCTVLAMVLLAAVRLAEPFLLWNQWLPSEIISPVASFLKTLDFSISTLPAEHPDLWRVSASNFISILLILLFTLLYSSTGGLRSVVATDFLQFFIAIFATFCYAWIVIDKVGGFRSLTSKLTYHYAESQTQMLTSFAPPDLSQATLIFMTVLGVQWFAQINADGTGYLAQRTMACKTDEDAKKAAVIFTFAQVVLRSLFWIPIALGLLIIYPAVSLPVMGDATEAFRVSREATFATGIKELLPTGIRGLMLTGMLAALASTLDTHLNWGSSYLTNDLYKRFVVKNIFKREAGAKELVWIARLSNIFLLLLSLVIMANLSSIQTAWHLSLLFGSGLGVVLIARWLWHRMNLYSEISAVVISIVFSPILLFVFPDLSEGARLLWMVIISTSVVFTVTLLTRPEPADKLQIFFERVNPPGWWAPFEKSAKSSLLRLKKASLATVLATISAFLMLIGATKIMLGNPGFGGALLGVGFALIPLWWKLGMKAPSGA